MTNNFELLVTLIRTEGLREVLRRLARRFLEVHTFSVYRLHLSDALATGQAPEGIEIKEVSREQLNGLRKGRPDLPEYFYRDESEPLDRCWVGLHDGRLGFICWVSYRGSDLVSCGANEAKVSNIFCLKELRGRRVTTNAVLMIARALFEEGITSLLAVPDSKNPAIVKSLLACGFVRVGSIKRLGLFTWPRTPVDYSGVAATAGSARQKAAG